eukprot:comp20001_c0_seq1/m.24480 comp20001_c0_seq1/g.24480  ORF comp20001_c0_seq1/g.24480 comp20001_c0_seq1/m.24480 type:complete len:434 (-) comp20001_c0_seq1:347-1648(-)
MLKLSRRISGSLRSLSGKKETCSVDVLPLQSAESEQKKTHRHKPTQTRQRSKSTALPSGPVIRSTSDPLVHSVSQPHSVPGTQKQADTHTQTPTQTQAHTPKRASSGSILSKATQPSPNPTAKSLQHISERAPECLEPTASAFYSSLPDVSMAARAAEPAESTPEKLQPPEPVAKRTNLPRPRTLGQTNSTATVYAEQSITMPDRDIVLLCVAKALNQKFTAALSAGDHLKPSTDTELELLLEARHPLTKARVDDGQASRAPSVEEIYNFTRAIFKGAVFEGEVMLVAMVYATRVQTTGGVVLLPSNWKWVLLGCILLAAKAWDDMAVWVNDFKEILPAITLDQLNALERLLLGRLMFNLSVSPREYAQHYFDLRQYTTPDELAALGVERAPLDVKTARKLEAITVRQAEIPEWKRWQSTGTTSVQQPALIIS